MARHPEPISRPNHRHIYMIVAGLALGLVMSQAVMGRVMPGLYERLFVGPAAERAAGELHDFDSVRMERLAALRSSDVTPIAMEEFKQQGEAQREALEQRLSDVLRERDALQQRLRGWSLALVLAAVAVMVVEASLETGAGGRLLRLIDVRYALLALWLALLVAQPGLLALTPLPFLGGLLLLALVAVMLPLSGPQTNRNKSNSDSGGPAAA